MSGKLPKRFKKTYDRYNQRLKIRRPRQKLLKQKGRRADLYELNTPDMVEQRLRGLGREDLIKPVTRDFASESTPSRSLGPMLSIDELERTIGNDDLVGVHFLYRGAQAARSVGRIELRSAINAVRGYGTGFMVGPQVLMTNHHVLTQEADAAHSVIEFDYFELPHAQNPPRSTFRLLPQDLFIADEELDFAVVAVQAVNDAGDQVVQRGRHMLRTNLGEPVVGERVNIIQHPSGRPQMVAVRDNTIVDMVDDVYHYTSDTERGSSGAPAFSDNWDLVALHHSGVPARDEDGNYLMLNGEPWDGNDATMHLIRWVANEGIRIQSIVQYLADQQSRLKIGPARLLAGALDERGQIPPVISPDGEEEEGSGGVEGLDNGAPLRLTIRLEAVPSDGSPPILVKDVRMPLDVHVIPTDPPDPGPEPKPEPEPEPNPIPPSPPAPTPAPPPGGPPTGPDGQPYMLDEQAEQAAIQAYYQDVVVEFSPGQRFDVLRRLLERTHTKTLSYREARLDHLYPWVDLREDGLLKSVYSEQGFDASEVADYDRELEAFYRHLARERLAREGLEAAPGRVEEAMLGLETQQPYNCEHVVPQSWFGKRLPMRADLHHLFTCEPRCNSFRGNIPYWEFPPEHEAIRENCGQQQGRKFEPHAGKGAAARATLYFLLRYPGQIGDQGRELQPDRMRILLNWHDEHPVTDWEKHRNQAIAAAQGNRNPLIDHPEWSNLIDFGRGFGG